MTMVKEAVHGPGHPAPAGPGVQPLAAISSFAISILLSGSVTNPINSTSFQAVAPWGKSPVCASLLEAVNAVFEGKGGNPWSGRMGAYFLAQTLNGATGTGPTGFLNANEVGA